MISVGERKLREMGGRRDLHEGGESAPLSRQRGHRRGRLRWGHHDVRCRRGGSTFGM